VAVINIDLMTLQVTGHEMPMSQMLQTPISRVIKERVLIFYFRTIIMEYT